MESRNSDEIDSINNHGVPAMLRVFESFGFVGLALFAAADAAVPEIPGLGGLANMTAVGVLAWWCWSMRAELQDLRKANAEIIDKLCNRWDSWEQIRHADNEKLDGTLREMAVNCNRYAKTG